MFKKLVNYLVQVRVEMAKVSWPTRAELMESTRIVLVLAFVLAVAVFIVDRVLSLALEQVL
jgi:preprotein translocase subunit SecE